MKQSLRSIEEELAALYQRLNEESFYGKVGGYRVSWSRHAVHTHGSVNLARKTIRISYPLYEQHGWEAVEQTLIHELTHAFIYLQGGSARHTKRFWREFERRGGVRQRLTVTPRTAYIYACPTCGQEIPRLRRIRNPKRYSCTRCDRRYNSDHALYLKRDKGQTSLVERPTDIPPLT